MRQRAPAPEAAAEELVGRDGRRRAHVGRQVKALANNVREKIKEAGGTILGMEGENAAEWVLVDAGDVIVHVMHPAVREHYNLEELWGAAARARAAA